MYRQSNSSQDLKLDILELKKELTAVREDNQLLKVKIRKLQNEVSKRDRQIETLLDPRKSSFVKKVVSEKGATMIINLRERNNKLEKTVLEKESLIKRLQNDLQTKKLYSIKSADKKKHFCKHTDTNSKCSFAIPYFEKEHSSDSEKEDDTKFLDCGFKSVSMCDISQSMEKFGFHSVPSQSVRSTAAPRALSADRTQFDKFYSNVQQIKYINNDTKAQYEGLSREHLLSIIESLKNNQQRCSPRIRKGGSPESDLERNELLCDTPHQEIQQLQNYFMDMLAEVDQLKATIGNLQSEHDKTVNVLKEKDSSITKLANEIKGMKRPKSEARGISLRAKYLLSVTNPRKRSPNLKAQTQSAVKIIPQNPNEETEEEIINTCTYTETEDIEPQEKEESDLQIIRTRTMSIQKFDDSNTSNQLTQNLNGQLLRKTAVNGLLGFKNEDATRRQKYYTLMEQMQNLQIQEEDGDLETEYI